MTSASREATQNRDTRRDGLAGARLYFVCEASPPGWELDRVLPDLFAAGVDMIELRDKEADDETLIDAAPTFRAAARAHSRPFLINDRPDLVEPSGADGVHLGQEDMPAADAREALGPEALIGLSTHTPEQIDAAQDADVDYISVGPIWATPTKEGRPATGLGLVEHAARRSRLPFFAIGGIDEQNLPTALAAGASRICVVRAIRDSDDPAAATRRLRRGIEEA